MLLHHHPHSNKLCTISQFSPPEKTHYQLLFKNNYLKLNSCFHGHIGITIRCKARRRVRFEPEDENEDDDDEYGYHVELSLLESYSQSVRGEALIVTALVDDQEVEVLIFKGYSSCLNYKTSPDPSKSVLPQRAVIKSIDRIKGPFNPSNIEYIEKGLTWETFTSRLSTK